MTKPPALYLVPAAERPAREVAPPSTPAPPARDTSWRDLIRRLIRNPLKPR